MTVSIRGFEAAVLLDISAIMVFEIFLVALLAGLIGALFGLGGGVLIIPFLTLVEGIPVQFAVGASIVSVVATSSASAATYVQDHLTNLRLGMFLEIGTVAGAITGAYVTVFFQGHNSWVLFVLFGLLLVYAAVLTLSGRRLDAPAKVAPDRIARILNLGGQYKDLATGETIDYEVTRTPHTLSISYVAGIVSGLLGVGGGIIKVPTMNLVSKVPVKVASATSNFMIGVTAAASASLYFLRGQVHPLLAAPLIIGVVAGSAVGTKLLRVTPPAKVKLLFSVLLLLISVDMIIQGVNLYRGP
jgi:uncharacterized membrane protein YfcA